MQKMQVGESGESGFRGQKLMWWPSSHLTLSESGTTRILLASTFVDEELYS